MLDQQQLAEKLKAGIVGPNGDVGDPIHGLT